MDLIVSHPLQLYLAILTAMDKTTKMFFPKLGDDAAVICEPLSRSHLEYAFRDRRFFNDADLEPLVFWYRRPGSAPEHEKVTEVVLALKAPIHRVFEFHIAYRTSPGVNAASYPWSFTETHYERRTTDGPESFARLAEILVRPLMQHLHNGEGVKRLPDWIEDAGKVTALPF